MKKIITIIGILICLILIIGCKPSPLIVSRCNELKDITIKNIELVKELNEDWGYNLSHESETENYNRLCEKYTGEIKYGDIKRRQTNEIMEKK